MAAEPTFSLAEALNAQKALREHAGGKEEPLDLTDFVGLAAEEIDLLQEQGKSWDDIAAMINGSTGKKVTGAQVEQAYANLEESDRWDDEEYEDD
jgi:hypothetical protein